MDETLQKINKLLKKFNDAFKISANIIEKEQVANGLVIDELKNDGSLFIEELFSTFNTIIKAVSEDHELVYNEDKGLVIAKKVVTVDYVIEE